MPPSWMVTTADNASRDVSSSRTSVIAPSTDRQMCDNSLRAESTLSNYSDGGVSAPFLSNERHSQNDECIEMRKYFNQQNMIDYASSVLNQV